MKVYLKPTGLHSTAMKRVAAALEAHAPEGTVFVADPLDADFQLVHAIGTDAIEQIKAPSYAVIQYCGSKTLDDPRWQPLWRNATFIWSYYPLEDVLPPSVPFMFAPLGLDDSFRAAAERPLPRMESRSFDLMTMGFSTGPVQEAIEECAMAVARINGRMIHVGPSEIEGWSSAPYPACWQAQLNVSEATLQQFYRNSQRVAGLRHVEGFELPCLEGLVLGARPVVFDRPDMRQWYGDIADFVPECTGEELIDRLTHLLKRGPDPVTDAERAEVLGVFDWAKIAARFWHGVRATQKPRVTVAPAPAGRRRRLLWIGDAGAATGFERATRHICEALNKSFEVSVLGLNHNGDPTPQYSFPVYPCQPGGDVMGYGRVKELVERLGPAAVVIQNDPWNFPKYLDRIGNTPAIGFVAIDGGNVDGTALGGVARAIFWTKYGEEQARLGGYRGPSSVIPLGVDLQTYSPAPDRAAVRESWIGQALRDRGLPPDTFIVGAIGRNQWRKRLDLTIEYFARWIQTCGVQDAVLWLQSAPTSDDAWNLAQLARFWNVSDRVMIPTIPHRHGMPEASLVRVYNTIDVLLTTTLGEGFHLPSFEAMACGTPVIAPDWSALGEFLADGSGYLVPCTGFAAHPRSTNSTMGGVMDRDETVKALDKLYRTRELREAFAARGRAFVAQDRFRWDHVGASFLREVEETVSIIAG